jgi:hypothetical protein
MGILDNFEEWLDFEEEIDKDPDAQFPIEQMGG